MPISQENKTASNDAAPPKAPTALVFTGGGARAAYQIGALWALLDILDTHRSPSFRNPFHIICGSSAGAINATGYACRAGFPHAAVRRLRYIWGNIKTSQVYRSDPAGVFGNGFRWLSLLLFGWASPFIRAQSPKSLLDNRPLAHLLNKVMHFDNLNHNLASGDLDALAITATSYTTGTHLTFYQAKHTLREWEGVRRHSVACKIGLNHLMASSAIPFVFPARCLSVRDHTEWCGDGSMRQLAPISPAIHLGAEKVVVISTTDHNQKEEVSFEHCSENYPTLAQLGGHALSDIFIDGLSIDLERIHRINSLLKVIPKEQENRPALKTIDVLTLSPSKSIDEIAMKHLNCMPQTVRAFLRVLGVSSKGGVHTGGIVASHLLFEADFTSELINLAYADTMQRIDEIKAFFNEGAS
ncbi:MAG: patatin-like phospholipase family protein [Alcaligenaceae bacterium]|nr:patatin-like phospholipase family protein [Alcaligenaceae bacterium]